MANKNLIILIVGALIVLGAVSFGAYKIGYGAGYEEGKKVGKAAAQTELEGAVTNPLESMPSTNPFEETVNPFKDTYQNPFK